MLISPLVALSAALIFYPFLLSVSTGPRPTLSSYTLALKGISTFHSTLITLLALHFVYQQQWGLASLVYDSISPTSPRHEQGNDANPTITLRSPYANAITAWETGYLLQDTFALCLKWHLFHGPGKHILDPAIMAHHILLCTALLVLQYYILYGRERGIYIIMQFFLMNASTPLLNVRWWLRSGHADGFIKDLGLKRRMRWGVDMALTCVFFAARIWLVWWILKDYGRWDDKGVMDVWWDLRGWCKLGTGALLVGNAIWWLRLLRGLIRRGLHLKHD